MGRRETWCISWPHRNIDEITKKCWNIRFWRFPVTGFRESWRELIVILFPIYWAWSPWSPSPRGGGGRFGHGDAGHPVSNKQMASKEAQGTPGEGNVSPQGTQGTHKRHPRNPSDPNNHRQYLTSTAFPLLLIAYTIGVLLQQGSNNEKTGKPKILPKTNILPHMANEVVLARRKCGEKRCATLWDPVPPDLVALNCQILNFHDFRHSWKVASWQNTSKLFLGSPLKKWPSGWRSLRRKCILKNDFQKHIFCGTCNKPQNS